MKYFLFILMVLCSAVITNAQTTQWSLDKSHSSVKFAVSHLVISETEGKFRVFDGTLQSAGDNDFSDAKVDFTVEVGSIDTDNTMRDEHLKGEDFFDASKYPTMHFKSTSFKKTGNNQYALSGDLTIKDVTKPVTFDVQYGGTVKDPWGNIKAGFKASATIRRFDYNLRWNSLTEAGSMVVGDEVRITLPIEFQKK